MFEVLPPHFPAEKDTSNELLWVWSFPAVNPARQQLITSKCTINTDKEGEEEGLEFSFGHIQQTWYYLANFPVGEATTLPRVCIYTMQVVFLYIGHYCA